MVQSEAERKGLHEALGLLGAGSSSAFEYQLWVTFGDAWTGLRARLAAEGAIRPVAPGEWALTPAGEGLRGTLEEGRALSGPEERSRGSVRGARAGRPRAAVEGSSAV